MNINRIGTHPLLGSDNEAIYRDLTIPFTATGNTVAIRFADGGLEGLFSESWGIDNVQVVLASDPGTPLFLDRFESGARPEWSLDRTDSSQPRPAPCPSVR